MTDKIRLPEGVRPENYNLSFDIDLEKFVFMGKECIDLKISAPTSKIILHSSEMKINDAYVMLGSDKVKARVSFNKKLEQLVLSFGKKIASDAKLCIEFEGKITDSLVGIYRGKYKVGNKEKYLATTQLEAPYARQAFPCFDEPAMKATFDVEIKVNKNLQALSNMPVKDIKTEGSKKIFKFQQTPKMSTYLLYLAAGEFEFLEDTLGDILIRIVTTPGKKKQSMFALELTKKFVDYFQEYSGIAYPLPKLDMIALPDFASAAMENWGAITFRELALLYDPKVTSVDAKKRIAEVIAHELWHQWSGDLVTMEWWNDLWLNESFATFMAYKAVDHFFPEWKIWEDFIVSETDVGFDVDSIASTHPIEVQVDDPHKLEEIFDAISYNKGGSVLRMLETYLGEENFRKGVSMYLEEHKYGNAKAEDLWNCLEKVSNQPIKKVAAAWITQPGYPLVAAELSGSKLKLSQKRFVFNATSNAVWPIPLIIKTGKKTITNLMDGRKMDMPVEKGLVKINFGQTGFYRVKYDDTMLSLLKYHVANKNLPTPDRRGLQSDLFRLTRHGEVTIDKYLDFIDAFTNEDSYIVLSGILGSVQSMYFVFSEDESWDEIQPKVSQMFIKTFGNILARLGWDPKDGEPEKDSVLRGLSIAYLGFADHEPTKKIVLEKLDARFQGKPLHPNVRSVVYSVAADSADVLDKLIDIYEKSESPEEKRQVLGAMGNLKNPAELKKALDFSISKKVRIQDAYMTYAYASRNPVARGFLLDWTKKNWKQLSSYKKNIFLTFVEDLITTYVTRDKEKELRKFFKSHPVEYKMTIERSFDKMMRNVFWHEKNSKALAEYFRKRK